MKQVWKTRVDRTDIRMPKGWPCPDEIHAVFFRAKDDPGDLKETAVISIPEMPLLQMMDVLAWAHAVKARVAIMCDTRRQANEAALIATKTLTNHQRLPIERAAAGQWGPLG